MVSLCGGGRKITVLWSGTTTGVEDWCPKRGSCLDTERKSSPCFPREQAMAYGVRRRRARGLRGLRVRGTHAPWALGSLPNRMDRDQSATRRSSQSGEAECTLRIGGKGPGAWRHAGLEGRARDRLRWRFDVPATATDARYSFRVRREQDVASLVGRGLQRLRRRVEVWMATISAPLPCTSACGVASPGRGAGGTRYGGGPGSPRSHLAPTLIRHYPMETLRR